MRATGERERERSLLVAARAFCQLDRTQQVSERSLVYARIRGCQAEHRLDPGPLEALGAARVARLQDVDVRKLAVGGGGKIAESVLFGERGGTKQRVCTLLVATAGRVDERGAEGEPGLRLELRRAARFCLGRCASERANARIEAARIDRRA